MVGTRDTGTGEPSLARIGEDLANAAGVARARGGTNTAAGLTPGNRRRINCDPILQLIVNAVSIRADAAAPSNAD